MRVKASSPETRAASGDKAASPENRAASRASTIDFDPVVVDLGCDADAIVAGEDHVGALVRQVTIDAFPRQRASALGKQPATVHFVTL